jgi:hypothetical protein
MDTINRSKHPQPPAATAGVETAAMQAQVLEAGTKQKDVFAEKIEQSEDGTATDKKPSENGLKNYFVTALPLE